MRIFKLGRCQKSRPLKIHFLHNKQDHEGFAIRQSTENITNHVITCLSPLRPQVRISLSTFSMRLEPSPHVKRVKVNALPKVAFQILDDVMCESGIFPFSTPNASSWALQGLVYSRRCSIFTYTL